MDYGILYFWGVKNRRNNDLAITFSYVKKKSSLVMSLSGCLVMDD